MKIIKKIMDFVINHPIITMIIIGLLVTFIAGYETKQWNYAYFIPVFIIFAFLAPFIRKAKAKKKHKEETDYLAKKIAEEANKEQ